MLSKLTLSTVTKQIDVIDLYILHNSQKLEISRIYSNTILPAAIHKSLALIVINKSM